jgi:predicted amidophosphoribosyltransferase
MRSPKVINKAKVEALLRQMLGDDKRFRDGQWEAIESVALLNRRHDILAAPVFLVDDVIDSGWTMTLIATLLLLNGSGPVFPFALARATAGDS